MRWLLKALKLEQSEITVLRQWSREEGARDRSNYGVQKTMFYSRYPYHISSHRLSHWS
jgi:hypothetical protein